VRQRLTIKQTGQPISKPFPRGFPACPPQWLRPLLSSTKSDSVPWRIPFYILEHDEHPVVSACFSAQTSRNAKSVPCEIFDAKRLRFPSYGDNPASLTSTSEQSCRRQSLRAVVDRRSEAALPGRTRSHRTREAEVSEFADGTDQDWPEQR